MSQNIKLAIPLTLGVVAAALTDLDDRLTGRIHNLFLILICFFIASASIELLMPYPWLFSIGLLVSTFSFILLGALGQRYATIAFGALLVSIYSMLGDGMYHPWYIQPLLLTSGALWYNFLTLLGHLFFPIRPVQHSLAQCYEQLANYFAAKASLFYPDEENNFQQQLIALSMANKNLVNQLNLTKQTLLTRLKSDRGQSSTRRLLHYYFVAQDIHEQISSIHIKYQQLSHYFRYSDISFRFQRLLSLQALACKEIAHSIILHEHYQHSVQFERVFLHLKNTLSKHEHSTETPPSLSTSLHYLVDNLMLVDSRLANIETEQSLSLDEQKLSDDKLTTIKEIVSRITAQLTPKSPLFRHAVRMSLVLTIGYVVIKLTAIEHGYWIMLTSLFVCQPNYSATRTKLALRVIGTIFGVLIGLPVLYFIPSVEGQLCLIVISGVLFFAFRMSRYSYATLFITLLALLCFNLLGEGFSAAIPRIIDTFIGCAIAWFAVFYIWSDWQYREISSYAEKTLNNNRCYLDAILAQYIDGRNNSMEYRIDRRNAQNSDAELATLLSVMVSEPEKNTQLLEVCFKFLCINQSLLGYISALGAHRAQMTQSAIFPLIKSAIDLINHVLSTKEITKNLRAMQGKLEDVLSDKSTLLPSKDALLIQQIILILAILPDYIQQFLQLDGLSSLRLETKK